MTSRLALTARWLRAAAPAPTDAELLARFVAGRATGRPEADEAFASLVRRHGPMVYAACRRVLGRSADADDAFQATFLVLLRKAAAVRSPAAVGNWLYGVAVRTATHLRARAGRRRVDRELDAMPAPPPAEDTSELLAVLDEELAALPEKYRAAVVLCELEGRTLAEAAKALGVPQGTAASRLARGRRLLADRLARRGLAVTAAGVSAALAGSAAARVPPGLFDGITRAAVPESVATLTQGVLKMMLLTKLRAASRVTLAVGLMAAAVVGLGWPSSPAPARAATATAAPVQPSKLTEARFNELGAVLGSAKPAEHVKAILELARHPAEATAFIKSGLPACKQPEEQQVRAWVRDLLGDDAANRQAAADQLAYFAMFARPQLIDALEKPGLTLDQARLVVGVGYGSAGPALALVRDQNGERPGQVGDYRLAEEVNVQQLSWGAAWLRAGRAAVLLEEFGTPEARALLRDLATGHPDAGPTTAAKDALARLDKRQQK